MVVLWTISNCTNSVFVYNKNTTGEWGKVYLAFLGPFDEMCLF